MNMEQSSPSEKRPSQPSRKAEIEAMWETLPDSTQKFVRETSKETFEKVLQSEAFKKNPKRVANLELFRRYWEKIDGKPKTNAPSLNTDPSGTIGPVNPEGTEEKSDETEAEKMRATRLTKAIEKKLIGKQQELAGEIASLFMSNGFNFIERQVLATTSGKASKITRFIIFIDPQKIKDERGRFAKSISEAFGKALKRFDGDFKAFLKQYSDNQKNGFRIAVNQLLTDNNGWNFAKREDAGAILKYLRDNDKLLEEKDRKSYAMYMDPKSSILGHNLITIEIESEEISARLQPTDDTPKYADKVVFSSAPVLTIDIKEENGI